MIIRVSRSVFTWNDQHLEWLAGAILWAYLGDKKVDEIVALLRDCDFKGIANAKAVLMLASEISSNEELQKSFVNTLVEKFPPRWNRYGIEDAIVDVIVNNCVYDLYVYANAAQTDGNFAPLKRELRNALMKPCVATQLAELMAGALLRFVAAREERKKEKKEE